MKDRIINLTYSSALTELRELNSSFDTGVLQIAYHGENRNKTAISKQNFEKAIKSIYNCPVVCNYNREEDSLGGHDVEIVKGEDDELRIVNLTTPVGCIPESADIFWKEVTEEDGTVNEYLCADALIWKRQEAYKKIKEDGFTSQSMEIVVNDGELIDGVYHIYDFEFTAFCLLGNCEPCFESASLSFSKNDFKSQLSIMMEELKESLYAVNLAKRDDIDTLTKGGNEVLDKKLELLAEYGLDASQDEYDIEAMSYEELLAELSKKKTPVKDEEDVVEDPAPPAPGTGGDDGDDDDDDDDDESEDGDDDDDTNESFSLVSNLRDELRRVAESETFKDDFGCECRRYWFVDFSVDKSEVYCEDATNKFALYGFTYSTEGDAVKIDFECGKRKKYEIVDFDESGFEPVSTRMFDSDSAIIAELGKKYQTASDTIASMEAELAELRAYKAEVESANIQAEKEELFSQFEDLDGMDVFEALKSECDKYDLDVLEEKCFALRGRKMAVNFSDTSKSKSTKLAVEKNASVYRRDKNEMPYGGLFEEYNN